MTIGAIKLPKNIPNLNHILLKGVKYFELNAPKIKKIKEIKIDQYLSSPLSKIGQIPINKKTTKKTMPKLLLELILIFLLIYSSVVI